MPVGEEGDAADQPGQREAEHDALEHDPGTVGEAQVLEEEDDLETLAVDRGDAEQDQPPDRRPASVDPSMCRRK